MDDDDNEEEDGDGDEDDEDDDSEEVRAALADFFREIISLVVNEEDNSEETLEELRRRIAELHGELSYPSATKFRAALRKRGVDVSADFVNEVVADQGVRQLTAAAPRLTGHVAARKLDARWTGDVIDYQAKSSKGSPMYIMILQDVFSRFILAEAFRSKA